MTGEEMERAIEFLLKSEAALDTRLDQLAAQVSETGHQLQASAETQSEFIQVIKRAMAGLAEAQARTERILADTNARLNRLAGRFEQHLNDVEGHQ